MTAAACIGSRVPAAHAKLNAQTNATLGASKLARCQRRKSLPAPGFRLAIAIRWVAYLCAVGLREVVGTTSIVEETPALLTLRQRCSIGRFGLLGRGLGCRFFLMQCRNRVQIGLAFGELHQKVLA